MIGEPFLKIGTTFASFSFEGKTPVEKERLISFDKILEMLSEQHSKISYGILQGPVALFLESDLITSAVSWGVVGF